MKEKQSKIDRSSPEKISRLLRNKNALRQHLSRSVLLEEAQDHYLAHMTIGVICGAVIVLLVWASFSEINDVVQTKGKVISYIQMGLNDVEPKMISPDQKIKVVVKISPQDIGHIRVGQNARVRINRYDYVRYGGGDGRLSFISQSPSQDKNGNYFYQARIELTQNFVGQGKNKVQIFSDMAVTVDIITGKKTILSYVFGPFYKSIRRTFTER